MDTNNTPTLNPNTAMVSSLLDTIVNAIADSVMEKVAARLVVLEDRLTANAASAEPGADVAALITRIAGVEASVKEMGEKLDTVEGTVDEHQNTLDDHQGTLDELPGAGDIVTDDRISELVADELGEQLSDAVTEHLGDYVKADDIEDHLPDDLVRQQALEDAVGTAVSKLRIVIGD
jgi:tetrahydromethanopterin S-methyltransferase subunit B